MRAGISSACLYPVETEKALPALMAMGFSLYEIFLNTFSELRPAYLKELRTVLDAGGCEVKSVHPFTSGFEGFLLFSDYERRYEDGLELYKDYFEAANLLGASIMVLHGQKKHLPPRLPDEGYWERYARLFELGKTFGVAVAQENVSQFRCGEAGFLRRMREYLGESCGFVLDAKQAVRAGESPFAVCAAMGERLLHVHLNDHNESADCLLPGHGSMDFERLMRQLKEQKYAGDIVLEVYRRSYDKWDELLEAKAFSERLAAQY